MNQPTVKGKGKGAECVPAASLPPPPPLPPQIFADNHEEEAGLRSLSPSNSSKPDLNIDNHPNILSESRIKKMEFSLQNKADLRKHCIALAKIVRDIAYPDGMNPKHFSLLEMFQSDKYWNFFCYFWKIHDFGPNHSDKKEVTDKGLGYIKALFRKQFGVDLNDYRDDLEELYKKLSWSEFTKLMIIYIIRSKQEWCVVKDCENDTTMYTLFGGAGYNDSDHACENIRKTTGAIEKKFCPNRGSAGKPLPELLEEIAKTCRTCCFHHQHDSSCDSCFSELPNECSNVYVLKGNNNLQVAEHSSVAPCLVQESEQFKAVQALTKHFCDMTKDQIRQVTFRSITERYNNEAPFAFPDISRTTERKWDSCTPAQRFYSIRHAEHTAEKTFCRKCMMCDADCMNIAAKYKSGFHLHHMLPIMKDHNPGEGVTKSLDKQRSENRKTIMLCAGCHYRVTYVEEEEQALARRFESLGYYVVKETGEIKCKNAYDGLQVTAIN